MSEIELGELLKGKWLREKGSFDPLVFAPYNEEANTIVLGIVVLSEAPGEIVGEYWLDRDSESYANIELFEAIQA